MKGNYNGIASFYDLLSRMIFGKSIMEAQTFLLQWIKPRNNILIIGGGTGWILEELTKYYSSGLNITYVDSSSAMIALSSKRRIGNNSIQFLQADIRDLLLQGPYDTVITPFVLDNFSDASVEVVFKKIDRSLAASGLWLFADFRLSNNRQVWQKLLLKLMYYFFRFFCQIEADRLPDTDTLFKKHGFKIVDSSSTFHDFICSVVYKKAS